MKFVKAELLPEQKLQKNSFQGRIVLIIDKKLPDVYLYDPAVVDIAEDYMNEESPEYGLEYKDFPEAKYYLCEEVKNNGIIPVCTLQVDSASDAPTFVKQYKIAKFRQAKQGEIVPYIATDGHTEMYGDCIRFVKLEDLAEDELRSLSGPESLYVYDWTIRSYVKKIPQMKYISRNSPSGDNFEFIIVATNSDMIIKDL